MNIPITISSKENEEDKTVETKALLDTGAGGKFIDQNFVKNLKLKTHKLNHPLKVYNVDGTPNKRGTITQYVQINLTINNKKQRQNLLITGLGKQKIILGYPWFKKENPDIDWEKGTLTWRKDKERRKDPKEEDDEEQWKTRTVNPINDEEDDQILVSFLDQEDNNNIWINAKTNVAVELAIKESEREGKKEIPVEELVPSDLHNFLDVFNEKQADRFPDSRTWDHKIEMKEGFEPKSFKTYNLSPIEQTELDKFLKENLDKGYIR
jgi:hypothetical protein